MHSKNSNLRQNKPKMIINLKTKMKTLTQKIRIENVKK